MSLSVPLPADSLLCGTFSHLRYPAIPLPGRRTPQKPSFSLGPPSHAHSRGRAWPLASHFCYFFILLYFILFFFSRTLPPAYPRPPRCLPLPSSPPLPLPSPEVSRLPCILLPSFPRPLHHPLPLLPSLFPSPHRLPHHRHLSNSGAAGPVIRSANPILTSLSGQQRAFPWLLSPLLAVEATHRRPQHVNICLFFDFVFVSPH